MGEKKEKGGIIIEDMVTDQLHLLGNEMGDNLFYTLAHTPVTLGSIHKSGKKIIACMSNHPYKVKGHELIPSGIVARANSQSCKNIIEILEQHDYTVILVSQICKKYFDRETIMDIYKPRIFCRLPKKDGITNKLSNTRNSKIYARRM